MVIGKDGATLRDFNPNDFLTYQLNYDYDPKALAPKFTKYINRVLPDKESQNLLFEHLGYLFTKNGNDFVKDEKMLFLHGIGANGKSCLLEIVSAIIGKENTTAYDLKSLTDENGYYRAQLSGKILNAVSELKGGFKADVFKALASGEPISVRSPHEKPFVMYNYAKSIFNCNELPTSTEFTLGFFRRFSIIPFNVTITKAEKNPTLAKEIINEELSGVLNLILEGLSRLIKQGKFSHCQASEDVLKDYQKESDSVALFIDESKYNTGESYALKVLYNLYKDFCYENNLKPLGSRKIRKRFEHLGHHTEDRRNGVFVTFNMNKDEV